MSYVVQNTIAARDQDADYSKLNDMDTNLIVTYDQAAINAIRAAGADQLSVPRCLTCLFCTEKLQDPWPREWL